MRIPLIRPFLPEGTTQRVSDVLNSGQLVEGAVTAELEKRCARYLGAAHCVAVDSCTTGLEIALRCLKIGPGDEVIIPDYTFPATGLAVLAVGARPVIVDVDRNSMNIDMSRLETAITPATKAVMPVSTFGNPLDHDALQSFQQRHALHVIEDAACSFGAEYKGRRVGVQADITVFSLHPRKFITSARGGVIVTQNDQWADWLRSYKCFGKNGTATRPDTQFSQMGGNAMLPDVLSAIALAQMDITDEMLARRFELSGRYETLLKGVPGIALPTTIPNGVHSRQSFCVFVKNRDEVMLTMRDKGVEAQIGTYALHMHPVFGDNPACRIASPMPNSKYVFDHTLTLPLYHEMTESEQDEVVSLLKALVKP